MRPVHSRVSGGVLLQMVRADSGRPPLGRATKLATCTLTSPDVTQDTRWRTTSCWLQGLNQMHWHDVWFLESVPCNIPYSRRPPLILCSATVVHSHALRSLAQPMGCSMVNWDVPEETPHHAIISEPKWTWGLQIRGDNKLKHWITNLHVTPSHRYWQEAYNIVLPGLIKCFLWFSENFWN